MIFENSLQKIDTVLKNKTQKEIIMIYIMIIALIFTFSYHFFWQSAQNQFMQKVDDVKLLKSKIDTRKLYLQNNSQANIQKLDASIDTLQKELIKYKDKNMYIQEKLKTISPSVSDEIGWSNYLDSITKNAQKNNVKLVSFTNNYVASNESFGHILDIAVKCEGEYLNIIKFINSLEQSKLMVDLHTINMEAKRTLNTDLNISVWGRSY